MGTLFVKDLTHEKILAQSKKRNPAVMAVFATTLN